MFPGRTEQECEWPSVQQWVLNRFLFSCLIFDKENPVAIYIIALEFCLWQLANICIPAGKIWRRNGGWIQEFSFFTYPKRSSKHCSYFSFGIILKGLAEILTSILFSKWPTIMFCCLDFFPSSPSQGHMHTHTFTLYQCPGFSYFSPSL